MKIYLKKSVWGQLTQIFALVCFAFSPTVRAVDPPPGGGYPGNNTAEGTDGLFSLDTSQGFSNTALGFDALYSTTTGGGNTANGVQRSFSAQPATPNRQRPLRSIAITIFILPSSRGFWQNI